VQQHMATARPVIPTSAPLPSTSFALVSSLEPCQWGAAGGHFLLAGLQAGGGFGSVVNSAATTVQTPAASHSLNVSGVCSCIVCDRLDNSPCVMLTVIIFSLPYFRSSLCVHGPALQGVASLEQMVHQPRTGQVGSPSIALPRLPATATGVRGPSPSPPSPTSALSFILMSPQVVGGQQAFERGQDCVPVLSLRTAAHEQCFHKSQGQVHACPPLLDSSPLEAAVPGTCALLQT
jgi:hypothetical protein